MQRSNVQNNLLASENVKCSENNNSYQDGISQKSLLNGLHNARNILASLENSLQKCSSYEKKLLQCRASHRHLHDAEESRDWWDEGFDKDDGVDSKVDKSSEAIKKSSSYHVDLVESWSTMSIVCLQYQYEELSRRYESLLQAYNDKCGAVSDREKVLSCVKQRATNLHAQLALAHKALISVGEKYLSLRNRRNVQMCQYENRIDYLKRRIRHVVYAVDRARVQLDHHFTVSMASAVNADYALLLAEMRKCSRLLIENLQLKARLEEMMPGTVDWSQ